MSGYVTLDGTGDYVSTPDHASLDPAGTLEIIACFRLDNLTVNQGIVHKLGGNAGYRVLVLTTGFIQFAWGNGTSTAFKSSSASVVSAATDVWVRCVFDGTNWSIWSSSDPVDTDPASVSWTARGSGTEGTVTPIAGSAENLELGIRDGSFFTTGRLYCVVVNDGASQVANPDFRIAGQTSDGGDTFVDDQGRVWTTNGDAAWTPPAGGEGGPTAYAMSVDIDHPTRTVTTVESR